MRGFTYSLTAGFVATLLIGMAALMAVQADLVMHGDDAVDAAVLGQVGDDGDGEKDAPAATLALTPVEQLLEQLTPPAEGTGLPSAQRVVLSRDPFAPVVPEPVTDGEIDGDTDGGTDGETDGETDGGTDGDACTGDEAETVCDGVVVTLDDVTNGTAVVTVDGTSYTVTVGDEFATSLRVLAINDPCVTLLYGDEAFSICTGATVLK